MRAFIRCHAGQLLRNAQIKRNYLYNETKNMIQVKNLHFIRFYSSKGLKKPHNISRLQDSNILEKSGPLSQRFKKMLIKHRPWSSDDFVALFSWIFVGNTLFILAGTTTFISILLAISNGLSFQGKDLYFSHLIRIRLKFLDLISAKISRIVSGLVGFDVTFETAEANFKRESITLTNVRLKFTDDRFTNFDLKIQSLDVTLDLLRWMDGKGIVSDCSIKGVRGTIDRRHLDFSGTDPQAWLIRRQPTPSDLNIKSARLEDALITVFDLNNFRPYDVVIYQASLRRLRIQWLLFDLLCADSVVGEYDGALFSLNKLVHVPSAEDPISRQLAFQSKQERDMIRKLRVSGLNADMVNVEWIKQGTIDFDMFYKLPISASVDLLSEDAGILVDMDGVTDRILVGGKKLFQELKEREQILKLELGTLTEEETKTLFEAADKPKNNGGSAGLRPRMKNNTRNTSDDITFLLEVRMHHIIAEIPEDFGSSIFSINPAMIRPVVAYLNAQPNVSRGRKSKTPPIQAMFKIPSGEFDGSWTLYQCGLIPKIGEAVFDSVAKMVLLRYNDYKRKAQVRNRPKSSPKLDTEKKSNSDKTRIEIDTADELTESPENNEIEDLGTSISPEPRGIRILSHVGWWSVRYASEKAKDFFKSMRHSQVKGTGSDVASEELAAMEQVFNEMSNFK